MNGGFVKLYRSIESWEWYTDSNTKSLFLHCLIRANHKPVKWRGTVIEIGEFITSFESLSVDTGMTVREIRTSLAHLERTGEITRKTTNRFTRITVVKWADFQGQDDDSDKQTTSKRQTNDKQTTTNKNDKNIKNDKNEKNNTKSGVRFAPPTIEELSAFVLENHYDSVDPQRFIDYYTSNGWKVGRNPMKDWKATVRQWNGRDKQKPNARPTRNEPIPDYTPPKTDTVDIDTLKERLAQLGKRT